MHNDRQHAEVNCIINHLCKSIYMYQMIKCVWQYIKHCPDCHKLQVRRHQWYGKLNLIITPPEPFHILTMDFIVKLPENAGFNCLATITCKFSKMILLVPGKTTWRAQEWADVMIQKLLRKDWNISAAFINNCDAKFMSTFWYSMFKALNVTMLTSTAYYPQTDSQLKWINQTVKIAMQYYTARDEKNWVKTLPYISFMLNNSPNTATECVPNEVNFGMKIKNPLALMNTLISKEWKRLHSY